MEICRAVGHEILEVPPRRGDKFAAWVGEGRTEKCERCGMSRSVHPNGNTRYNYPDDTYAELIYAQQHS